MGAHGPVIRTLDFSKSSVNAWREPDDRHRNWPVVYVINNDQRVYVGESGNVVARMHQHLRNPDRHGLREVRIILDTTFNTSACLDLESFLIRTLSGDGQFQVTNQVDRVRNADYYQRPMYQRMFIDIFERLRDEGLFTRPLLEIVNSNLYKLSPFKSLNSDQAAVVEDILEGLFSDFEDGSGSTAVIEGGPGTGKTIVAIYLLKLLADIRDFSSAEDLDSESPLWEFFTEGHPELLRGKRIGFVVPQQSLRASIKKVFRQTPGLDQSMVLTPFDVAKEGEHYDLLVVDEAHRLSQLAAQAMGTLTKSFKETNARLASPGEDPAALTQIDWIMRHSTHQIFLLDEGQGVRPADVDRAALDGLRDAAGRQHRSYRLVSQMRVQGGQDYLEYIRAVLSDGPLPSRRDFPHYDLRFYDDVQHMHHDIIERERELGLARLVAGFAWPWNAKRGTTIDPSVNDIVIDGYALPWNRTDRDWINSATALEEVGSIHTVQGYDLNYAGVIIGPDLSFDRETGRIKFDRDNYRDSRGKENNRMRGKTYSDEEILEMVRNAYHVLLTRGIRGTYIYVCDPALREHLRPMFPPAPSRVGP